MKSKRKPIIILFFFCLVLISFLTEAAIIAASVPGSLPVDAETVKVPEGDGRSVLLDGLFSPGEWEDAEKINVRPNVSLYLKKHPSPARIRPNQ